MTAQPLEDLFEGNHSLFRNLLGDMVQPWDMLDLMERDFSTFISLLPPDYQEWREGIWIAGEVSIAPTASVLGPAILGPGTEVRHGAYVRQQVITGKGCVIGNATEVKNSLLFDEVQIPHFNYVGDAILGFRAHLGAGAILSNFRFDGKTIALRNKAGRFRTHRNKLGAIIGDSVEIGSNCVILPGSWIGKRAQIYPLLTAGGYIAPGTILRGSIATGGR